MQVIETSVATVLNFITVSFRVLKTESHQPEDRIAESRTSVKAEQPKPWESQCFHFNCSTSLSIVNTAHPHRGY
jgi:hypothetical protein